MEEIKVKVDVIIELLVEVLTEIEYKGGGEFEDKALFSIEVREKVEKMIQQHKKNSLNNF